MCGGKHVRHCSVKATVGELSVNHTTFLDYKIDPNGSSGSRMFLGVSKSTIPTCPVGSLTEYVWRDLMFIQIIFGKQDFIQKFW